MKIRFAVALFLGVASQAWANGSEQNGNAPGVGLKPDIIPTHCGAYLHGRYTLNEPIFLVGSDRQQLFISWWDWSPAHCFAECQRLAEMIPDDGQDSLPTRKWTERMGHHHKETRIFEYDEVTSCYFGLATDGVAVWEALKLDW